MQIAPSAPQHKATSIFTSFSHPLPIWLPQCVSFAAQAVAVCASETRVGGAYVAVVTEVAPALPEIPDVEEEAELAEEAPIAPPGDCPCY